MYLLQAIFLYIIILKLSVSKANDFCMYECDCAEEPTSCPVGISLVSDGCNCCKVCAKQLGQQCNGNTDICDPHKNLYCDFTKSRSGDWGVCSIQTGNSCPHDDGSMMPSGFMFQPSCKKRCWCMDGDIGCVTLCPHETDPPREDVCPNARLRGVPGQCCDEWVCDTTSGSKVLSLDKFWSDYVKESDEPTAYENDMLPTSQEDDGVVSLMTNSVTSNVIYDTDGGADGDELEYQQFYADSQVLPSEKRNLQNWEETNVVPGDEEETVNAVPNNCLVQSSSWGPCSKTCGLGISTRVSNINSACRLTREMRLCMVRQCTDEPVLAKHGRRCNRQKRHSKRIHFTYAGCKSLRTFKPRFCGTCNEAGRCCTPHVTRTSRSRFRCPDGRFFNKNIMTVRSCRCHDNCSGVRPVNSKLEHA